MTPSESREAVRDQVHLIVWRHCTRYAEPADTVAGAVRQRNWIEDEGSGSVEAIVVGPLDSDESWGAAIRGEVLTKLADEAYAAELAESRDRTMNDTRAICPVCGGVGDKSITAPDGNSLVVPCSRCDGDGRLPQTQRTNHE